MPETGNSVGVRIVLLALLFAGSMASAQATRSAGTATAGIPAAVVRPGPDAGLAWQDISAGQQAALQPLADSWASLSSAQKRKWIALSRSHPKLPAPEQALLHSRMSNWAGLSPSERARARLNFSESRAIQPEDRKAKWEAYQSLTPEQKKELARHQPGQRRVPPAVTAAAPAPAELHDGAGAEPAGKRRPGVPARVVLPDSSFDSNTLLPQQPQGRKPSRP